MASIATRTGDDATTSLLYGQRVPKHHPQIETVGAFDELNAAIGAAKALLDAGRARKLAEDMQEGLVALMGEVACAESDSERYLASKFPKIGDLDLQRLDEAVLSLEASGLSFKGWAYPGATPKAAAWDMARVVARRGERRLSELPSQGRSVRPIVLKFVNRLSDVLWLLAREEETAASSSKPS